MTSTIRAKQIVESPLPSLEIGPYQIVSSALQRLSFVRTLITWSNFLRSAEHAHAQPVQDIQALGCEYGLVSTYSHTIFLRQFQSPRGNGKYGILPLSPHHLTTPNSS
jgi:hypothetical protein